MKSIVPYYNRFYRKSFKNLCRTYGKIVTYFTTKLTGNCAFDRSILTYKKQRTVYSFVQRCTLNRKRKMFYRHCTLTRWLDSVITFCRKPSNGSIFKNVFHETLLSELRSKSFFYSFKCDDCFQTENPLLPCLPNPVTH